MVVGEHEVAEGQVADALADEVDPLPRHEWRGARLDGEDRIGADDAADVRITLCGVRVDAVGELLEGGFLLCQIGR